MTGDVVIADIGGQALDIFLHGPQSAHKNGIVKTFTHTSIPKHPCTLLKKQKNCKTLNSPNMMVLFTGPRLVQCAGERRPGSLADTPKNCSMSEAFSPRTVLTETICRCLQHTLQHFSTRMAFLATATITFSCLASSAPQADSC